MTVCKIPGCKNQVVRTKTGLCRKHADTGKVKPAPVVKTEKVNSKADPDDAIIKEMWARENKAPPALPPPDGKTDTVPPRAPGTPSAASGPMIAALIRVIGSALAENTKIEEFRCPKDLSDEIGGYVDLIMAQYGKTMDPVIGLIIALAAWLVPGIIKLFKQLSEKDKAKLKEAKRKNLMTPQAPPQTPPPATPPVQTLQAVSNPPTLATPPPIMPPTVQTENQQTKYPKMEIPNKAPGVI